MSTKLEVVYPSTSSASGTSQINFGPYNVPTVGRLLRAEVRGQVNFQGATLTDAGVLANVGLWAVQWVPQGNSPSDIVTTADGAQFLIREQMGTIDMVTSWAPTADDGAVLGTLGLRSFWAGQQHIGASIDLYLSLKTPTGVGFSNFNLFASLRFWWSLRRGVDDRPGGRAWRRVGRYCCPWWALASTNLQGAHQGGPRDVSCPEPASIAPRPAHLADTDDMANRARMVITVTASRGASNISFSTKGRYISLPVNWITASLPRSPVQPTASALAFWQSVIAIVTEELPAAAG